MAEGPRSEQLLSEMEARLNGILAITTDAIITIDQQQRITLFNDGAEAIFGYHRVEILGRPLGTLLPERYRLAHQEHVKSFASSMVHARSMGERQQIFGLRKDGLEFPAEAAISKIIVDGQRTFTVVLRDISERRRTEDMLARSNAELEQRVAERTAELSAEIKRREETQAQLIRNQRMEAFGQLTGGVAHDFNNLLTVIIGNLELLEMRLADEKDRALLKRAQDASEMGARLTTRLLTFARRRTFETMVLDLNEQIAGMVELLNRSIGEHIHLMTRLSPGLWAVRADPSEIENALLNLSINARDAMPKGGKLVIDTANVSADADEIGHLTKLPAGDYVRLAVSDTGSGMPADVLQRAFEPFFTTKPPGKGTGLGLSTIYGFLQSIGGTATIYSEDGRGTTVNLYLPRHAAGVPKPALQVRDQIPPAEGEAVLLVEDNAEVREVTHRRLEDLGYRVIESDSGPDAIEKLRAGADVQLVLSDVVMPGGMSGIDVATVVAAEWPAIKLLLTSGYAEDILRDRDVEPERFRILRKPYSRAELAQALRRALEAS